MTVIHNPFGSEVAKAKSPAETGRVNPIEQTNVYQPSDVALKLMQNFEELATLNRMVLYVDNPLLHSDLMPQIEALGQAYEKKAGPDTSLNATAAYEVLFWTSNSNSKSILEDMPTRDYIIDKAQTYPRWVDNGHIIHAAPSENARKYTKLMQTVHRNAAKH